jgi:tetratricopeptide (TPR) repeat protein
MICMNSRLSASLFVALGVAATIPAAGIAPVQAQEIVQRLPDPAAEELNGALRRLSRNPESVPALVAAGRASLELNDIDAALGFFNRAQAVAPEDGRVLAGLGLVAARQGDAVRALRLFADAEAAGEPMAPYAAEQGLAYDLVGRNDQAQRLYRIALSEDESAEVLRRLALSQAIAGNADASEATLLPLLQRQDRAAYRTRAFALAIRGRDEEAIAIAETMLPPRLSRRLAPYFRYMPRLTRAQQAAAANLGRFPSTSEMGRDTAEIAAFAPQGEQAAAAASTRRARAGDRLAPAGRPLGPSTPTTTTQPQTATRAQVEAAPVQEPPTVVAAQAAPPPNAVENSQAELPRLVESAGSRSAQSVEQTPSEPAVPPETVAVSSPDPQPATPEPEVAQPSFSLLDLPDSSPSQAPASAALDPAPAQDTVDLAEAFADFTLEAAPVASMAGAVDITKIQPRRERPQPEAPPPPVHPARHWVQVATGQDTAAFRFDWRRIKRNSGGLLDDAEAFMASWGQTNRLLTGPYASAREAQEMVSALAAEGVDSFRFSSEEGEEIQSID